VGAQRKHDLDRRLEAYFAALPSCSLKAALKRSIGNWQAYAAVTGSAMAMVTNASASRIGNGLPGISPDPIASARTNKELLAARDAVFMQRFLMASPGKTVPASQAQAPSISPGGIVPLDGSENIIQPGEWVSIFGSNLANGTTMSNGDFPTSLSGTSVEIDGKPAFLLFVSPGQINLQAPDDSARGKVSVVVTTASGSAPSSVTLSEFAPSFVLLGGKYVSGIILRPNHSGGFGGGSYDILGPSGSSFGYPTVAAQAGDTVELYAVGLGPTTPLVQAGKPYSGAAPISNLIDLYINNILVRPTFVGLSSAGLYQINLTVPSGLGTGDVPISAMNGGLQTQAGFCFRFGLDLTRAELVSARWARVELVRASDSDLAAVGVVAGVQAAVEAADPGGVQGAGRSDAHPIHTSPSCDLGQSGTLRL
jgi:uncharacterized protein (TIGR03437 family)